MFYEINFPSNISFKSIIINEFKTNIITSKNGEEQRNSCWLNPKIKYNIVQENLSKSDINTMLTFFKLVKGKSIGFRFKDWTDFIGTNEILGIYDDTNCFQLQKHYSITDLNNTSINYTRNIIKPVINSVSVYINDIQTRDFTVNYTNGEIEITGNLTQNDVISANFEFDVPARFDVDFLQISMNTKNSGSINNLNIIEI